MKILLIEDDVLIAEPLAQALESQHYSVETARDGQTGWDLLEVFAYDLVLLDVMVPKLDGIHLCRRLRSQGNPIPILLLTAQDSSTEKVMGLDAGADDYVVKPFDMPELLARVRALLRRSGTALPPLLTWQNLVLDPSICEVTCNGQSLHLTPKEYSLLELFLRNPHRIFSVSGLIDQVWSFEELPSEDTIRSHIRGLRQKLRAAEVVDDPIETVYGIGYRLKEAEHKPQLTSPPTRTTHPTLSHNSSPTSLSSLPSSSPTTSTFTGISNIWEQVKGTVQHRVSLLEQAITLLHHNQLTDDVRQQAVQTAHKLIGSLGMFGVDRGSQLAQAMQPLLEQTQSSDRDQLQQLSQLITDLRYELQQMPNQLDSALGFEPEDTESIATELVDIRPWLMIVSNDQTRPAAWAIEASHWGLRAQIVADPVAARTQITEQRPDAVILDFQGIDALDNHFMLLSELRAYTPPVPLLVVTEQTRLLDRVKIARLGGGWVLQEPVSAPQVLEVLNQQCQRKRPAEARVLVVDDDIQILIALQQLLIPWGLKVTVLDNPLLFLEYLETSTPDVLILDIEMPHVNGIELCEVVRNDPRWSSLPILFLTAHADQDTMHRVFAAGADDYVRKPIVGPELITRIFNRLERSHLLQLLSNTDALTGVANRRAASQALTEFLQWSQHCQQPLCLAVMILDQLGPIAQSNHATADAVLSRFGELLRQTFHGEDVVGRWGGAEFVVGMVGMTSTDGKRRLTELRQSLHGLEVEGRPLRVTLQFGIAHYPQNGNSVADLYAAAKTGLRQE